MLDQELDYVKCKYCLQARYTTGPDYLKISMVHVTTTTLKSLFLRVRRTCTLNVD